jgi:hypothetical protein
MEQCFAYRPILSSKRLINRRISIEKNQVEIPMQLQVHIACNLRMTSVTGDTHEIYELSLYILLFTYVSWVTPLKCHG